MASRVREDFILDVKMDEMLSSICRWGLHTKVLDVVPECMFDTERKNIVACSLLGKNGRCAMLPVFIPYDGYQYEFRASLGDTDNLKNYKYMFQDNPDLVLILFPSEINRILVLEKKCMQSPLRKNDIYLVSCVHQMKEVYSYEYYLERSCN